MNEPAEPEKDVWVCVHVSSRKEIRCNAKRWFDARCEAAMYFRCEPNQVKVTKL